MQMTGNKCLLDTSVIVHAFKSRNDVAEKLDAVAETYVPVIVLGELYYGAYKSMYTSKHMAVMQAFLQNCTLLAVDSVTADVYGTVKAALARKGNPIPENDIWIAALALQHGLPLFTTDKHFEQIPGIVLA
jgi:tRNA(fMet)-specific endonuclease VapC